MSIFTFNGFKVSGDNIKIIRDKVHVDGKLIENGIETTGGILTIRVIEGSIGTLTADGAVSAGQISGSVSAGGAVNCANVGGNVSAEGAGRCGTVGGSITAGGSVRHA